MNQVQVIPPAIIQGFDYAILDEDLATKCQAAAGRIKGRFRTTLLEFVEIGRDLIAIQEKMPHGAWGPWLEAEFGFTDRTAQNYMNTATFMEGKSETVSLLPPATLYALASRSADPGVIEGVLADVDAGKVVTTADVKEKLAKARAVQKKASASARKSPEQIKKEQAALERADRAHQKKVDDIDAQRAAKEAREAEAAGKAVRLLVTGLGAAGTIELFTIMNRVSFDRVQQLLGHRSMLGDYSFLPESEIEAKFGGAP
jgi:Protein of unknown function (DUF3102)